jgi:hypothetical protein
MWWWMKALGPAGPAVRNLTCSSRSSRSSHGLLLLRRRRTTAGSISSGISITAAAVPFSTTAPDSKGATRYPPRPKPPPDHEFTEVYLKGTGPGGQKIVRPQYVLIYSWVLSLVGCLFFSLPFFYKFSSSESPALTNYSRVQNRTRQIPPSSSSISPRA